VFSFTHLESMSYDIIYRSRNISDHFPASSEKTALLCYCLRFILIKRVTPVTNISVLFEKQQVIMRPWMNKLMKKRVEALNNYLIKLVHGYITSERVNEWINKRVSK